MMNHQTQALFGDTLPLKMDDQFNVNQGSAATLRR